MFSSPAGYQTLTTLLVLLVTASNTSVGSAKLVSADDPIFGLASITQDSETQLEWLDVALSTGYSYSQISDRFGLDEEFQGFRFATSSEIETLFFSSAGIINAVPRVKSIAEVTNLQSLVSITSTVFDSVRNTTGYFDDSVSGNNPGLVGIASLAGGPTSSYSAAIFNDSRSTDFTWPLIGGWLVRQSTPIPEPSSVVLLACGILFAMLKAPTVK